MVEMSQVVRTIQMTKLCRECKKYMETILTIVAIAAGIVVVVLLAEFYKKATQMNNEEPREE